MSESMIVSPAMVTPLVGSGAWFSCAGAGEGAEEFAADGFREQRGHGAGGQPHDQRNFEHPEGLAVELRIPIADRTAENPVRDRPELAAGIIDGTVTVPDAMSAS